MPRSRVSGSRRKTSRKATSALATAHSPKPIRFIGLSLSGGKADKACVAVVEYFPEHKKIFLARLLEKVKTEETISADLKILDFIHQFKDEVETIAFDVPLSLPTCLICPVHCGGYETCHIPENVWMREFYSKVNKSKKPKKLFTPYTQRCVEAFISHGLEEPFEIHHALGSNIAPLTARAQYLKRRLDSSLIEVYPRLSIWRLGQDLKVAKSHLRYHKHAVGGDESRRIFLQALSDKKGIFIYQQDMKSMVENNHAFEAFVCAYTAFLKYMKATEPRPTDFPKNAAWIEFPK
jgi:hypothetical protein